MEAPPQTLPFTPLRIASAGICCSLGYTLDTASVALQARLDHFQSSHFKTPRGEPLLVAQLPETRRWGGKRLGLWLQAALRDCLSNVSEVTPDRLAVLWLAPGRLEVRHAAIDWGAIYQDACDALELRFHAESRILAQGRASLSVALERAHLLLQRSDIDGVLVVGVDSLLDAPTIGRYLNEDRLLTPKNADGFIPGEAAAAVLLQRETAPSDARPSVHIVGHGRGIEAGRVDGSVPSRAQGLAQALRAALSSAALGYADLEFRCADQNGEAFYAKEASHAFGRIAPVGGDALELLTIADGVGEVGAALGPLMLAHLSRLMRHPLGPGACGILHLADDDGARAAAVLELR
ncbi:beta-ketoacyl synthase N-terminal-like domain-containing protein [Roseateles chitinivorans]|uniref:beta-ketoacyl synthase N-terminal-like domain-containing protein n=1 Tax=Roseateles chitinivorans TaxID=2917965 RepID=UPI003D66AEAD